MTVGKRQIFFASIAALTLSAGATWASDCQLTEVASLDVKTDSADRLEVPVTMEGHQRYLLLETGDIYNSLTTKAADEMDLNRVPANPDLNFHVQSSRKLLNKIAVVHSFGIGNLLAGRTPFMEVPDDQVSDDESGSLGISMLTSYDFEIDPAAGKLNLFSQDHCPGQAIYWTRQKAAAIPLRVDHWSRLIVPVQLDGHTVYATLDTGSTVSYLIYGRANDVFPKDKIPPAPALSQNLTYYPFKTLSLDGVDVANPSVALLPDTSARDDVIALSLGMDVLSHLHMFISYKEHKLYVTAADAR